MASKSAYHNSEKGAEIEELLTELEKALERVKLLYEQYFMGMAKVAPMHQHSDLERKVRDVTQLNVRNTALRYRFASITQKFSAYNTYWKRTLREIESGRYVRNLSKIKRRAEQMGSEIPAEILAAMPKRMQDQVKRDRELALKNAERRGLASDDAAPGAVDSDDFGDFAIDDGDTDAGVTDGPAQLRATPPPRMTAVAPNRTHRIDEDLGDFDVDAMFAAIGADDSPAPTPPAPAKVQAPLPRASIAAPTIRPPVPPPARGNPPSTLGPASAMRISRPSMPPPTRPAMPAMPAMPARPPPTGAMPAVRPPIPRPATPAIPRSPAAVSAAPPPPAPSSAATPGMSEADVRVLYAKYVKAREMVGAKSDEGTYQKLLRTIQQQAPKIMEQYKSDGVEFGVVIKDQQVILKAKPKGKL